MWTESTASCTTLSLSHLLLLAAFTQLSRFFLATRAPRLELGIYMDDADHENGDAW